MAFTAVARPQQVSFRQFDRVPPHPQRNQLCTYTKGHIFDPRLAAAPGVPLVARAQNDDPALGSSIRLFLQLLHATAVADQAAVLQAGDK